MDFPHRNRANPEGCRLLIVEDDLMTQRTLEEVISRMYPDLELHLARNAEPVINGLVAKPTHRLAGPIRL